MKTLPSRSDAVNTPKDVLHRGRPLGDELEEWRDRVLSSPRLRNLLIAIVDLEPGRRPWPYISDSTRALAMDICDGRAPWPRELDAWRAFKELRYAAGARRPPWLDSQGERRPLKRRQPSHWAINGGSPSLSTSEQRARKAK